MKTASEIIHHLYKNYYNNSANSEVTSSHWKNIGNHSVQEFNGQLVLNGYGFGYFRGNTIWNKTYFFIELLLTKYLEIKFHADKILKKHARDICKLSDRLYDFDCLKQVLSLQTISRELNIRNMGTVCIIGDGYGFMGCLLKKAYPHLKIISVNLGKTLLFDVHYTASVFKNENFNFISFSRLELKDGFNFLDAENYSLLENFEADLFINIASMQEMDNSIIRQYFNYIRSSKANSKWFYCCNRVEKKLPDGEVTRIDDYPWGESSKVLEELCPWYQLFPYHRPPFWRSFDGPIKHIIALVK
jgi:hypothetical protein